jgi:hypothetical protein
MIDGLEDFSLASSSVTISLGKLCGFSYVHERSS